MVDIRENDYANQSNMDLQNVRSSETNYAHVAQKSTDTTKKSKKVEKILIIILIFAMGLIICGITLLIVYLVGIYQTLNPPNERSQLKNGALTEQILELKSDSGYDSSIKNGMETFIPDNRKACENIKPIQCWDLYQCGARKDKNYTIYLNNKNPLEVQCDMENGGWTVIAQRCSHDKTSFHQTWSKYKDGFGTFNCNYWIGLELMHKLTTKFRTNLRIDLWNDNYTEDYFIVYENFIVNSETDKYRLNLGAKLYGNLPSWSHYTNGLKFTTFDNDNDNADNNCAAYYLGGWWHGKCYNDCITCQGTITGNYNVDNVHRFFNSFQMKMKYIY